MAFTYRTRTVSPRHPRPGPNGLPRGQVTEIQRSRMLAAAVDAVEEVGYARMTVAQVIGRARVSRKTFYDVFADREDCFLAAFEQALSEARLLAQEAYERESNWREGVRGALARLLMLMDEEPGLARLCVVEALAAGERVSSAARAGARRTGEDHRPGAGHRRGHDRADLAADLADTLPYLVEYPYGCVEQTMSRFLPAIRWRQDLEAIGLSTHKELEAKLPKVVEPARSG